MILEEMEKHTPDGSKMDPLEVKFRNLKDQELSFRNSF